MSCIDEETLGVFVEGKLDAQRRRSVMEHLQTCEPCTLAAGMAAQSLREETAVPHRWRMTWWLAAAAVLATVLAGVAVIRERSPMRTLVAAAPADHRLLEPRLTGGFAYAEYRGPARDAGAPVTDPARLALQGAAGAVLDRARHDASARTTHAAGVALLLIDDPAQAIQKLRGIAGGDAKVWSDLSAAYYTSGRPSLYPQALAAADRALAIDARMPEALFNRALVLERMGLQAEARKAWERYIEVDSSSPWADEARVHLARLGARRSSFQRDLPRLSAEELVARYPQEARTWGEGPFLAEWADGHAETLARARAIGDALAKRSNERLLHDAVAAIDRAPDVHPLIAGHLAYRDGRVAYSRRELAAASSQLQRAADLFARAGSPMELAARYFAANVVYDLNRPKEALAELTRLLTVTPPEYRALRAQILWQRALCSSTLTHWNESVEDGEAARKLFDELGEESNRAFVDVIVSEVLASGQEVDEAWQRRIAAFDVFSRIGAEERLVACLGAAVRAEADRGNTAAAQSLAGIEIDAARQITNRGLLVVALLYRALLSHRSGAGDPAPDIAEARGLAAGVGDAARVAAEIDFAEGVIVRARDPRLAVTLLTRATDFARSSFPFYLPSALLQRGRANRTLNRLDAARADFAEGIDFLERQRDPHTASQIDASALFDDEQTLFGSAVDLALARRDVREALTMTDRAMQHALRSRFSTAPRTLQADPVASDEAVIEIYDTGSGVVVFCATRAGVEAVRVGDANSVRTNVRSLIEALAARAETAAVRLQASALYDRLIAPIRPSLSGVRRLIFVSDPRLGLIPFAVLFDASHDRYLIEDFEVATRPAMAFPQRVRAPLSNEAPALIVAAPETSEAARLPGAEREAADVAACYRGAAVLQGAEASPNAFLDALRSRHVVHYAGHAVADQRSSGALLLAGGRLYASDLARLQVHQLDLVVLAACRSSHAAHEVVPRDLATAFLVAGAANVVGTGWQIDDATSAETFSGIHRAVAAGERVSAAVRDVQLSAIRANRHPSTWGAITVLSTERS